ncbi:MAG: phage baseplate protein [Acidobacteriia bacterium]|nr:phage baseplate protein [Terriglobia bacterium]
MSPGARPRETGAPGQLSQQMPTTILNADALLAAWERGASQPPVRRPLILLSVAWPDVSAEEWAGAGIGERDERLFALREVLFGPDFETIAACPRCGERLELNFRTADICPHRSGNAVGETLQVQMSDYHVEFRLPNTHDLLAVENMESAVASSAVLERCISAASCGDAPLLPSELPAEVMEAVIEQMAGVDAQADLQIAISCPGCRHEWTMLFDIASYLWSEIEDWARGFLRDVHVLASLYGWTESEVLSLSAVRRQIYIDMATG